MSMLTAFVIATALSGCKASGVTVYVSSDPQVGSDDNAGTSPSVPLLTLAKASEVAAKHKAGHVKLSGLFDINKTFTIGSDHAKGLTVDQWQGKAAAVISGGFHVRPTTWTRDDKINRWTAPLPADVASALSARGSPGAIFVNNKRRSIVRTPTLRWTLNSTTGRASSIAPKGSEINKWGFVYNASYWDPTWKLDKASLAKWRVVAFHSWVQSHHTVANVNQENNTIMFAEAAHFGYGEYGYCSEARYYIEGIPHLPLSPGSWRLVNDEGTPRLEYTPVANENFPPAVVVPFLDTVILVKNVDQVVLQNITIAHAGNGDCGVGFPACDADQAGMATAAVKVQSSASARMIGLTVRDVGAWGLQAQGATGLQIQRVAVLGAGAGGIELKSCHGCLVNNSIVRGYGYRFPAGTGVQLSKSPNSTASHCEVSHGLYSGLAGGGDYDNASYTTYEYNHVHSLGSETEDGICDFGGFHGATHLAKLPLFMRHNIFHNITAYANGGHGMYFDFSSNAWQVSNNLVYDVAGSPLLWNGAPDVPTGRGVTPMRFVNNVFIAERDNNYSRAQSIMPRFFNGTGLQARPRGLGNPAITWNGNTRAEFKRNVVVVDNRGAPSRGAWFGGEACAQEANAVRPNCTMDFGASFLPATLRNNLYFNSSLLDESTRTYPGGCNFTAKMCGQIGCSCRSWEEWTASGHDLGSLRMDPKLRGQFMRVTEPKALSLGIQPLIELARAGPDWQVSALPTTTQSHSQLIV